MSYQGGNATTSCWRDLYWINADWATCHDAPIGAISFREQPVIVACSWSIAPENAFIIRRASMRFTLTDLGYVFYKAVIRGWIRVKRNDTPGAKLQVVVGNFGYPLIPADYGNLGLCITVVGEIALSDIVEDAFNEIDITAGLPYINVGSPTLFAYRISTDILNIAPPAGVDYSDEVYDLSLPQIRCYYYVVTTDAATGISDSGATLNATLTDGGTPLPVNTINFQYADTAAGVPTGTETVGEVKTTGETLATPISGLLPGKTYYFRAKAVNASGTYYGEILSFTTLGIGAPTVTNNGGAADITAKQARLYGEVTDTGGEDPSVLIYYGETDGGTDPSAWDFYYGLGPKPVGEFNTLLTPLTPHTTYYYRCYAINSGGEDWAPSTETFRTLSAFKGNILVDQMIYQHAERMRR